MEKQKKSWPFGAIGVAAYVLIGSMAVYYDGVVYDGIATAIFLPLVITSHVVIVSALFFLFKQRNWALSGFCWLMDRLFLILTTLYILWWLFVL